MIIKQYIKDFESLGLGMFVHLGIYSVLEAGEWLKACRELSDEEYFPVYKKFSLDPDWARNWLRQPRMRAVNILH